MLRVRPVAKFIPPGRPHPPSGRAHQIKSSHLLSLHPRPRHFSLPTTSTHTGSSCVCASGTSGASSAAIASGASGASKHSACGGFSPRRSGSPLNAKNQDRCLRKKRSSAKGRDHATPAPPISMFGKAARQRSGACCEKNAHFFHGGAAVHHSSKRNIEIGGRGAACPRLLDERFFADTGLNTDLGVEFR